MGVQGGGKSKADLSALDDRQLLELLINNDQHAFAVLWRRYGNYLLRVCRAVLKNPADAEEVHNQVAIAAWQKLPLHAANINNLKAWLGRLARNLCLDAQRRNTRQDTLFSSIDVVFPDPGVVPDEGGGDPEDELLHRELQAVAEQALHDLPVTLRETAVLCFAESLDYGSICDKLGIERANARKRVEKARRLMQSALTAYGQGHGVQPGQRRWSGSSAFL